MRGATFSTSLAAVRLFVLTSRARMKAPQEGLPSLIYLKQSPGLFNVCLFTLVHSRQLSASQSAATLTASCCKMSLLDTSFTFLYVPRGSFFCKDYRVFWVCVSLSLFPQKVHTASFQQNVPCLINCMHVWCGCVRYPAVKHE